MHAKPRTRAAIAAATVLTGLLATGCATSGGNNAAATGGTGNGSWVVGYSQSNNAEPYRAQLNIQLQYYMKQYKNMKLLPITDAHQDSATQVSQVQNFVSQKVNTLIVSPNEPGPLTAPVQQACAAHIPVIILDRTVNTNCYTTFIGGNNYQEGKLAGEYALKTLPNGGNVVELRGIMSDTPQILRDKGFRDAIKANPKIHIIESRDCAWLKQNAEVVMQQWLQKDNKIDLVYSQNDPMALGAYLAAKAANRTGQMKFIGGDGLATPDGGIRAVQLGELDISFIYPTAAKQAAEIAEKISKGQKVPHKWVLPITPVTKQNATKLYSEYNDSRFQS